MRILPALQRFVSMFFELFRDAILVIILGARSSVSLQAENLFLRKQLALYLEREMKPKRANDATRLALALLSNLFSWKEALVIVKPETLIGWHRKGFRLFWRWKSRPRGRPRLPADLRALIVEMARSNPTWGEERIASELLLKLGIRVSPRTVRCYLPEDAEPRNRVSSQRWMTFIRNHAHAILACDFFVSVTASFRLLYVFVIMEVGSRLNLSRSDVAEKIPWNGVLISIQPRIRLNRSFDQVSHVYLDYSLRVQGNVGGEVREFLVGIGAGAQAKHQLEAGDAVCGDALPVADPRLETVEFYKVSNLKVTERAKGPQMQPPPWFGMPQPLPVYRERGHRRLAARRYETKSTTCIWGCHMAVEMIIDQWNPGVRRYRTETFCYGSKSCALYEPGPLRKVPGRKGMSYTEEDWIDEQATAHRSPDE